MPDASLPKPQPPAPAPKPPVAGSRPPVAAPGKPSLAAVAAAAPPPPPAPAPTANTTQGSVGGPPPPSSAKPGQAASAPAAPAAPKQQKQATKPVEAKPKRSFLKFIPLILGGIALLSVLVLAAMRFLGGGSSGNSVSVSSQNSAATSTGSQQAAPSKQITLQYWGLWEESDTLEEIFDDFSAANPGILVQYRKQSHREYRERLESAIASGTGPDVFRFHAAWTPMLKEELEPAPSSVMTVSQMSQDFYPVVSSQLVHDGEVVGLPLMYDGLALFYNKKALETAAVSVPQTWADLKTAAKTLTIRSGEQIDRAGAALGAAANIEHFSDILGLLLVQNGANLENPSSTEAIQALTFYTDFMTKDAVWDRTLPNSIAAFAEGKVAMIFAPSWRVHEIVSMNPELDFDTAPVPKLTDAEFAWASYWAEGVSSQSDNSDAAWKLLEYMASEEVQQKLYSAASQEREFGPLYSRVDMASEIIDSKYVGAFLEDAPQATSWYMCSSTHDSGINDEIIRYYADAVNGVTASGTSVAEAMSTVSLGVSQILTQYGASSAQVR